MANSPEAMNGWGTNIQQQLLQTNTRCPASDTVAPYRCGSPVLQCSFPHTAAPPPPRVTTCSHTDTTACSHSNRYNARQPGCSISTASIADEQTAPSATAVPASVNSVPHSSSCSRRTSPVTHQNIDHIATPAERRPASAPDHVREADGCWYEEVSIAEYSSGDGSFIDEEGWATSSEEGSSSDAFSDVGDPAATEVVFVREGVGVWPSRACRILGRLSLVKQHAVLFLAWLPYSTAAVEASPAAIAPADLAAQESAADSSPPACASSTSSSLPAATASYIDVGAVATVAADGMSNLRLQHTGTEEEQQPPLQQSRSQQVALTWIDSSSTDEDAEGCNDERQQPQCPSLLPVPLAAPRKQVNYSASLQQQQVAPAHASDLQKVAGVASASSRRKNRSPPAVDSARSLYAIHPVPLSDIKAFVKYTPPLGCHHITVVLNSGLTLPPLYFHNGGAREFLAVLKQHASLVKAAGSSNTYLVNDTADPLQRCLLALDVADIMLGAPPPGANCVEAPTDGPLAHGAWQAVEAAAAASPHASAAADADGWAGEPGWGRPLFNNSSSSFLTASAAQGRPSRLAMSSRARLAAAAAAAAVGGGSSVLPHLPWGGFGVGYAGASSYGLAAASCRAPAVPNDSSNSTTTATAVVQDGAAESTYGNSSGPAAASVSSYQQHAGPNWASIGGVLGSALSTHLTTTLSKVGQLAVEGASNLVAAAVESWHAETMRHYEYDVELRREWEEQGVGLRITPGQAATASAGTEFEAGLRLAAVEQPALGSSSSSPSPSPRSRSPVWDLRGVSAQAAAAPASSIAAQVAAAAGSPITAAPGPQSQTQQQHRPASCSPDLGIAAQLHTSERNNAQPEHISTTSSPLAVQWDYPATAPVDVQQRIGSDAAAATAGAVDTGLGSFELLESSVPDQLAAVRSRAAPPPLTLEELNSFLEAAGVMSDEAGFRERVFQAGVEPSARREAWKFLLGVYPPNSSAAARHRQRLHQEQQYAALKGQWSSIGAEQAKRWGKWRERRSRIDKDVRRTDRLHPFYRGRDAVRHLTSLRDVLRCYCLFNWDLGYCQGMSDLASPLLVVMEGDEVDAFWCFVGLMERLESNFATDQAGMHKQLAALRKLVQVLDPQLHAFFEARDCLNYFFAFRWLLIHFKREFPFEQVLTLWESCWACPLTPHLHLYLAAAVLIQHRRLLLSEQQLDFDGMLRFCVELSGKLDVQGCLRLAETLALIAGQAGAEILQGLP